MTMEKSELKEFAQEAAKKLGETEEKPIAQIELLIELIGREFVEEKLNETMSIEEKGGMKTEDGKRRRTAGGVFFYLAKGKMDAEIRQQIFPNFGQGEKRRVVQWDERREFIDPLLEKDEHGEMRYVTITLRGRPAEIVIEGDSVMTVIEHRHKQTPMPRGVPHPPDSGTCYTVYMARKQWEDVAESIETYKSDRLIIEGSLFFDKETETLAVFAMKVTSRRTEKMARKEAEAPQSQKQESDDKTKTSVKQSASVTLPEGIPSDVAAKMRQLYNAAETLRERIANMEAKGQAGVSMTKKLLHNTEKQIEVLEKQYPS
jgi:Phosphorylated adapter RNA export protein, RNA-binding domain